MLDRMATRAGAFDARRATRAVLLGPFWLAGAALGAIISTLWLIAKWVSASSVTGFRDAAPDLPKIPAVMVGWTVTVLIIVGVVVWL